MAEIKQMTLNGTTYNLKDETARNSVSTLEETVSTLEETVGSIEGGGSDVSYTASLTSGTKVGTLTIDGTSYSLYAPTNTNTTYSAGTNMSLSSTTFSTSLNPYFNSVYIGPEFGSQYPYLSYDTPNTDYEENGGDNSAYGLCLYSGLYSTSSGDSNYTGRSGLRLFGCVAALVPEATRDKVSLGTSAQPFGTVYCSLVEEVSDKNLKQNIVNIQEDSRKDSYLDLFDGLDISTYKFKNLQSEDEVNQYTSENHKRTHIGLIAQDVENLIEEKNLSSHDFSAVKSEFFRSSSTFEFSTNGGWQIEKDGYDYSENTYNYKHSFDEENPTEYHTYNEIIGKSVSSMNIENYRSNIQYLHVTDNSKLTGNQPPLTINAIIFEKEDGTQLKIDSFSLDGNVCDYCPKSASYEDDYYTGVYNRSETPMSSAVINDNGSITISFDRMYGTYLIKLFDEPIDITEYETVYFDVDYISEYKFILYPEGEYKNSEWGDREYNDPIIYNYFLDYREIANLTTFALQETRKELAETKAELEELKEKVNELLQ